VLAWIKVDGKVLAQVSELDQVWKVKRVAVESIRCGNHGGGDDLPCTLYKANKEVDKVASLSCLNLHNSESEKV